jgi:hypothetical protein
MRRSARPPRWVTLPLGEAGRNGDLPALTVRRVLPRGSSGHEPGLARSFTCGPPATRRARPVTPCGLSGGSAKPALAGRQAQALG